MTWTRIVLLTTLSVTFALPAGAQEPRRFTRTPYLSGPDDPERGQVRGTIQLGETVVIEIPGGYDSILEPGVVPEFLTPPDLFSQIGLGIPLIALYELSIISVGFVEKKRRKKQEEEEAMYAEMDDMLADYEDSEETDFNYGR